METNAMATAANQNGTKTAAVEKPAPRVDRSPYAVLRQLREDMDQLMSNWGHWPSFGSFFPERFMTGSMADWKPAVEVEEKDGKLMVRADIPGVKKEDVKVEINDDAIIVKGERKDEREEKKEGYYRSERSYGSFYRSIPLPKGADADAAKASFNDGVLEVVVPVPTPKQASRSIDIM